MSELTPFVFPETSGPVRTIMVGDNPWFHGGDVCRELGLGNVSMALSRLGRDEKVDHAISETDTLINTYISESGLYRLIFTSNKESAERFRTWIATDVLPQIRKTGAYAVELSPARQLLASAQHMVDIEDRQIALAREMEKARIEAEATRDEVEVHAAAIINHGARLDSIEQHTGFVTILAWCRQRGIPVDNREAARMGKAASTAYRQRTGLQPKKTGNEKYGYVNMYPEVLLGELFA